MLEEIRKRIDPMPDYADMNPYQLWFDCRYLLSELDYYKAQYEELNNKILKNEDSNHDWYRHD